MYSLLIQTYVKTLRSLEDAPVFLASLTNSWSIDNWEQLLNIVNKKFVEQPFISLLQTEMKKKLNYPLLLQFSKKENFRRTSGITLVHFVVQYILK